MSRENEVEYVPELELVPDELAMLFAMKGWIWDVGGDVRSPNGDEILDLISILAERIEAAPHGTWATLGRFIVYKDPEFPNHWGIALDLGYMPKELTE